MTLAVVIFFFLTLQAVTHAQKGLFGLIDRQGFMLWTDDDEFDKQIRVYQPNLPTSEWRMLGQTVQNNYNNLEQPLFRYRKAPDSPTEDFKRPEGFVWIWDDRLSYASKDVSVWRATCPAGYVALGDFFYPGNRLSNPVNLFDQAACVREALTQKCSIGAKIWDDSGSGATYDVSVWAIAASPTQVQGHFHAHFEQQNSPSVQPYCLDKKNFVQL